MREVEAQAAARKAKNITAAEACDRRPDSLRFRTNETAVN
jgi:hypothetical protein